MIDPEQFIEAEIASGTDARALVLMACACVKIAVMASCREEGILIDALRTMWTALTGETTPEACREAVGHIDRVAGTQRWKSAQWFTAHSVLHAARAVLMLIEGFDGQENLFHHQVARSVGLARFGIDPLISAGGDRRMCQRMSEILKGERKAA